MERHIAEKVWWHLEWLMRDYAALRDEFLLTARLPGAAPCDGRFSWKFSHFRRQCLALAENNDDRYEHPRLWSPPFYCGGPQGYRLRCCVRPNHNFPRAIDERWTTIFLTCEKGEFDCFLKWPFCTSATISVIHPTGSSVPPLSKTAGSSCGFARPQEPTALSFEPALQISWPLSLLAGNGYLQEDALYVQIECFGGTPKRQSDSGRERERKRGGRRRQRVAAKDGERQKR